MIKRFLSWALNTTAIIAKVGLASSCLVLGALMFIEGQLWISVFLLLGFLMMLPEME